MSDLRPQIGARAPEWCGCPTCAQASQLKFHDLHLDSFRMLQALEWQPSALQKRVPKPPPTSRQASDGAEAVAGGDAHNPGRFIVLQPLNDKLQHIR